MATERPLSDAQRRALRTMLANEDDACVTYPGQQGTWAAPLKALERRGLVQCAYQTHRSGSVQFRVVESARLTPAGFEAARSLPPEVGV